MTGRDVQAAVFRELGHFFEPGFIISEWSVRREATDTFRDLASYAPRLDIAVGPFNSSFENRRRDAMAIRNFEHPIVEALQGEVWRQNHGGIYYNRNPRCLVAIEIEHSTSSKHILGAITNASMLGLLGVIIGSGDHIAKVRRIHEYACKLKEVEKAHEDMFGNVACFADSEFFDFIRAVRRG